jgi:predicted metal-dependent HD superfamily phosphohydrolase
MTLKLMTTNSKASKSSKHWPTSSTFQTPLRSHVSHYIEATITHSLAARDEDGQDLKSFLDFDLEVLGRNPLDYALYATQIRKEYGHFSDTDYAIRRLCVLGKFLGRQRLFFSDSFHAACEARARQNLEGEIAKLKKTLSTS